MTQKAYDTLASAREERINTIKQTELEIVNIESEMKKLEGSFNTLVDLAKEEGLIDENGNIIKKEDDVDGNNTKIDSSSEQEG